MKPLQLCMSCSSYEYLLLFLHKHILFPMFTTKLWPNSSFWAVCWCIRINEPWNKALLPFSFLLHRTIRYVSHLLTMYIISTANVVQFNRFVQHKMWHDSYAVCSSLLSSLACTVQQYYKTSMRLATLLCYVQSIKFFSYKWRFWCVNNTNLPPPIRFSYFLSFFLFISFCPLSFPPHFRFLVASFHFPYSSYTPS